MRFRKLKLLGLMLVVLPFCAFSCSGCMTAFEAATLNPRPGRLINGRAAIVYSSRYEIDLWGFEKAHSFDIHKYHKMVVALVDEGYLSISDIFVPGEVDNNMLGLVHTSEYLAKLRKSSNVGRYLENPKVGLLPGKTTDARLLRAFRVATGGTVLAARLAWQCGLGINIGGGYHHAQADRGEGFCIYADVPIAIRQMQREGLIRRVLLVDLDVHQGNGNAKIFKDDKDVFTFSIHQENLYPKPKARSDLDVGLLPPVDDKRYLAVLADKLPDLLDSHKPQLVVVLGGVDTYHGDPLAGFSMTAEGILRRDEYAVGEARRRGIPVLYVTSGGYSREAWRIQYRSIANLLDKFAGPEAASAQSSHF